MTEQTEGCVQPAGRVGARKEMDSKKEVSETNFEKEKNNMEQARVGAQAPDFEMPAFYKGGFTSVKLSDYTGKWFLLCFYPGDFTFV